MKKNINVTSKKLMYYIVVFFIILLIHQLFHFMNDDITYFSKVLNEYTIQSFVNERYNTWTSRIIIEVVLINITRNIYVWRILNSLVITLLIYTINKIFYNSNQKKYIYISSLIFFLYPYYQMSEAGFAATTLNYLWPLTFLLYAFIPFQNIYKEETINKKLLPTYIIAFLFACNQEQATCVGLFTSIVFLIYCIKSKKNKKSMKYPLTLLLISIFSLFMILACPGNAIRRIAEINNCYPDYINANIYDKIFLGVVSTCSILISNFLIIFLLSALIFIITFFKGNFKKTTKISSAIQFIIILLISIYRVYTVFKCKSILDAYKYGIFYYHTEIGHILTFSMKNIFILIVCVGMALNYCYLIYNLLKEKSYFPIVTLLVGCGTRVIMGFSPTIFASGNRTMIFMYFSLLFVILTLWKNYEKFFSTKQKRIIEFVIITFIIANYILTIKAIPLIENL